MSEEHRANDVDEIFRKGIEPLNSEPSEEFWRKSADNIILMGNKANDKKASRWRIIAFVLGAGLLLMGYLTFRMESGLNKVEQQMVEVKRMQNQNTQKLHAITGENKDATTGNSNKLNGQDKLGKKVLQQNPAIIIAATAASKTKKHHNKTSRKETADISIQIANYSSEGDVHPSKDINTSLIQEISDKKTKLDSTSTVHLPDSSSAITVAENPAPVVLSRFSLSAFFSPDFLMAYSFTTSGNWGSEYATEIKKGEKESFSFTAGAKAEYELCSRLSVGLGLAYQTYSFQIAPSVLYSHYQSDGEIGYNIYTSSGVVDCPYYGSTKKGDSLKMSASSSRNYLNVPIDFKYFFYKSNKVQFFVTIGGAINISLNDKTVMNWETFTNYYGSATVTTVEGLQNMYYSWLGGVGIRYDINKRFAIYAEPDFEGSITSLNKNSSVVTFPYVLGTTAGITMHL